MGEEEKKKTKLSDFDLVGDESPHIHEPWSSQWKMLQVIIALCIPLAAGTLIFGWQALIHTALGVLVAVATEYLYERFVRHRFTIDDLYAVVTGMLVGMSMPNGASYWATALVALFAIGVVKMFAGGLGSNRFNPAVAGRVIYLLFPWFVNGYITGFGADSVSTASYAHSITPAGQQTIDAVSASTPLYYLSWGNTSVPEGAPELWELFLGNQGGWGGALAETSTLAILIAMIYLILRRIITIQGPALYIGTVFIVMLVYGGFDYEFATYHILSGAVVFAGTFMVTDYSTSGLTPLSRWIFPIGAGLLTALFRITGFSPEGAGLSILAMNAIIPYIDRIGMPTIYGHESRPFLGLGHNDREPLKKKDILADK